VRPRRHGGRRWSLALQVWDVVNDTKMDHPFHLHGFFFQVIEANGAPVTGSGWKDTVKRPGRRSRTDRLVTRRPAGIVDVPLPHPRAPRRRDDGALRGRPLIQQKPSRAPRDSSGRDRKSAVYRDASVGPSEVQR
jgi:hypothetical protein